MIQKLIFIEDNIEKDLIHKSEVQVSPRVENQPAVSMEVPSTVIEPEEKEFSQRMPSIKRISDIKADQARLATERKEGFYNTMIRRYSFLIEETKKDYLKPVSIPSSDQLITNQSSTHRTTQSVNRVYGQGMLRVPPVSDIRQIRYKSRLHEEMDYDDLMMGEKMKQQLNAKRKIYTYL